MQEQDEQEEVPLDDPPLASAPAAAPAAASDRSDPLSLLAGRSGEGAGYQATYPQQQQQQQQPRAASSGEVSHSASSSNGAGGVAPAHRSQPSLTLDSLEIGPDDSSLLRGGGGEAAGPSRPAPAMHITVSDPVRRVGDSMIPGITATHTEYLVATAWEAPRRRVEVRRRFRDFVALADLLAITQRGYFVFPRRVSGWGVGGEVMGVSERGVEAVGRWQAPRHRPWQTPPPL
jgi:sorting nexin-1/2